MIKFRQKEYSKNITKALYLEKKALNSIRRASKKKTALGLKRAAVKSANDLKHTKNELILDTGHFIGDKVIRPTIEAPVTGIASKVIPVPGMTATQLTVLAPIEKRLQPKLVREGLEKVGKFVGKTSAPIINASKEIFQHNPGVFFPGI